MKNRLFFNIDITVDFTPIFELRSSTKFNGVFAG